jgi:hypothetical protein
MPPLKPCPNPACGRLVHDWHAEWLSDENRALVDKGQAGVDCPECGAFILIPGHVVTGVAADTAKMVKRSRKKAESWTAWAGWSLEDYLKTTEGSQYVNYDFEP